MRYRLQNSFAEKCLIVLHSNYLTYFGHGLRCKEIFIIIYKQVYRFFVVIFYIYFYVIMFL